MGFFEKKIVGNRTKSIQQDEPFYSYPWAVKVQKRAPSSKVDAFPRQRVSITVYHLTRHDII